MKSGKQRRAEAGQSLIETILITPLLLLVILNFVNLGYFFLVAVNIAAAPRSGVEYAIVGFETPGSLTLPSANPPSDTASISYLVQQDMTGAVYNPTSANVQICTPTNFSSGSGLNGSGSSTKSNCRTCTGTTCGTIGTGSPSPDADPEAPLFILSRVDIDYSVKALIPGTPFGLALLPLPTCSASGGTVSCGVHRQVSMRVMN